MMKTWGDKEPKKLDLRGIVSRQIDYEGDDSPSLTILLGKNPMFRGLITADEIWQMFDNKKVRIRIEVLK